jgi:hypothetical protein
MSDLFKKGKDGDVNKRVKNKLYDDLGIDNPYLQNQPKGRIDRFKDFVKRIIK